MGVALDLTGKTFNSLTAVAFTGYSNSNRERVWIWDCECGNRIESPPCKIQRGGKKSCGCIAKAKAEPRRKAQEQGLNTYSTGEPCEYGHISERYVSNTRCVTCCKIARDAHKNRDPVKYKQMAAEKRRRNKEAIASYHRKYNRSSEGKAVIRKRQSQPGHWARATAVINKDPQQKIRRDLGSLMRSHFKQRGLKKTDRTVKLLGAPLSVACAIIELQFQPGMTWENHGDWEYDHIRPCASFDLTDPEQQAQCFHYTNLQPLWRADNRAKSDKWEAVAA